MRRARVDRHGRQVPAGQAGPCTQHILTQKMPRWRRSGPAFGPVPMQLACLAKTLGDTFSTYLFYDKMEVSKGGNMQGSVPVDACSVCRCFMFTPCLEFNSDKTRVKRSPAVYM